MSYVRYGLGSTLKMGLTEIVASAPAQKILAAPAIADVTAQSEAGKQCAAAGMPAAAIPLCVERMLGGASLEQALLLTQLQLAKLQANAMLQGAVQGAVGAHAPQGNQPAIASNQAGITTGPSVGPPPPAPSGGSGRTVMLVGGAVGLGLLVYFLIRRKKS